MKETIRAFQSRTGLDYAPPSWLVAMAEPLDAGEACPTLFRYPGPEGLLSSLRGDMQRLAPTERRWVWLSETAPGVGPACDHFGVIAVLEPLRLFPCASDEPGAYLAVNDSVSAMPTVWVPPTSVAAPIPWDELASVEDAMVHFGPEYEAVRAGMVETLQAYLEEVAALGEAAPGDVPWYAVDPLVRGRLLEERGVRRRWTP